MGEIGKENCMAGSNRNNNGKITFEITERIGALDRPKNDWTLECNMVAWNGGDPKIDIRSWSPDHQKMTRGITLTEEQGERLVKSLGQRMLNKQKARTERDTYER